MSESDRRPRPKDVGYLEIYERLAELAPSVHFSASKEPDHYFSWDGDGPDPRNEGFTPHDVEVKAQTIVGGKLVDAVAHLGASYYADDEPIGDIHGYLPQKLEEAILDLATMVPSAHQVQKQLAAALKYVRRVQKINYQAQVTK